MQQIVAFDQIKSRAAKLGLSIPQLARKAGMRPSTVYRIDSGETGDPRMRTLQRLAEAVAAEEADMRRHLRELERSSEGRQLDLVDALARRGTP